MPKRLNQLPTRTLFVLAVATLLTVASVGAEPERTGEWTLRPGHSPGHVHFSMSMSWPGGGNSHTSSDVPEGEFDGLDLSASGRREVRFSIVRDAGRLDFDGLMDGRRGSGFFQFTPDPNYVVRMEQLGFDVDEREQFGMTLHDVSIEFAQQMRDADIRGVDTDSLLAFRIHGVSLSWFEELRREGQSDLDADDLIAFRIHGVSAGIIRELRASGYDPDSDELIALRIHGASPEWIDELSRYGYEGIDLDDLIAFRIHGVSPEFIGEIQTLGYPQPDPGDLIAMRIHNVSPSFVRDVQSRGMGDLTIDELVGMKIRGFN